MCGAGRKRRPKVLTDLNRKRKRLHRLAPEQKLCAEKCFLPGKADFLYSGWRGAVVPLFVEFTVVRNVRLRHQPQKRTLTNHSRAVVELSVDRDRKPHERDKLQRLACLQNLPERGFCRVEKRLLQKKIAAGVARETQLGKDGQLAAVFCRLLHCFDGFLCVIGTIRHAQRGGDGACLDKTVIHGISILFSFF